MKPSIKWSIKTTLDCGKYQEYLRQGRGKRKSRNGAKSKRGGIPGRVDISKRPVIADQKTEIGHWESDTMIGGNHLGFLVTHVDKASKFLVAGLAKNKTASEINRVTEKLFQEIHLTDGHIFQYKDKYCYVKASNSWIKEKVILP